MSKKKIAFIHPDLGIGGAERLFVDAAVGLQSLGHDVRVFTSHCSPTHSFRETQDGTLKVSVHGDWLPTTVFGRCKALFAYIRMFYVSIWLLLSGKYDVIFIDQVSHPIPLLKIRGAKTIFYCHYPDKCLTKRESLVKKLYRAPLDYFEGYTTGKSDIILVNSNFTARVFKEAFPSITKTPHVLYPAVNFKSLQRGVNPDDVLAKHEFLHTNFFLSINRFEGKKNIDLAVEAFSLLRNLLSSEEFDGLHLVIAGGYDPLLVENREVYHKLKSIVDHEGLNEHVTFMPSFSDEEKEALLTRCFAVLYTPSNEHFGIVPVEGMYFKKPVIAVNSGGPKESVKHESTGILCPPTPASFSSAMSYLLKHREKAKEFGEEGHRTVIERFSSATFSEGLNGFVESLA